MYYLLDNKILVKANLTAKKMLFCKITYSNLKECIVYSNRLCKCNNKIIRSLKQCVLL